MNLFISVRDREVSTFRRFLVWRSWMNKLLIESTPTTNIVCVCVYVRVRATAKLNNNY